MTDTTDHDTPTTSLTELPSEVPMYEAFDGENEYVREAFTIHELPVHLRHAALVKAAKVLGLERIRFGVPIYESIGLTKAEARTDGRGCLFYRGCDLPLDYFWHQ